MADVLYMKTELNFMGPPSLFWHPRLSGIYEADTTDSEV